MGNSSVSGKKTTTIKRWRAEMTRLRVYVNPESRDSPLVHSREKKHSDFALSELGALLFQIGAAVLIRSASADNEMNEKERMLKCTLGIIPYE
jgi:hypothetical protein